MYIYTLQLKFMISYLHPLLYVFVSPMRPTYMLTNDVFLIDLQKNYFKLDALYLFLDMLLDHQRQGQSLLFIYEPEARIVWNVEYASNALDKSQDQYTFFLKEFLASLIHVTFVYLFNLHFHNLMCLQVFVFE